MHVLDRPVWASLDGAHAVLAEGGVLARRYQQRVNLFASARGETPFLHARRDNHVAIALYASLGFPPRAEVNVAVLERA